jgi:uncharacterized protein YcfJ
MKMSVCSITLALAISAVTTLAEAKGCLTGAVVGGVAGHYAHHTVTGAIAGCYLGHHIAREKQQQQLQVTSPSAQPRDSGGWERDDRDGGMGGR